MKTPSHAAFPIYRDHFKLLATSQVVHEMVFLNLEHPLKAGSWPCSKIVCPSQSFYIKIPISSFLACRADVNDKNSDDDDADLADELLTGLEDGVSWILDCEVQP